VKSILFTGSKGYIARNIASRLKNCNITLTDRTILNPLESNEVNSFFKGKYFDVVFHTAIKGGTRLANDEENYVYQNCLMHFNILKNEKSFGKYISFGSGAELDRDTNVNENSCSLTSLPQDPYGMSKILIALSGEHHEKFYNIRIFNIFNEDELPTRMIKSNLFRYINHEDMIIHQDKLMDFMYFDDFMNIINYYIDENYCPKTINCSYKEKYLLTDIAKIINNLGDHRVNIKILNEEIANSYIGKYELDRYNIKVDGLISGIEKCYSSYLTI
jgi:nucleoside-diphosphate-sugar epimerase